MEHPNVVHSDDVPATQRQLGDLRCARRRLGAAAGCLDVGLSRWEVAAGARSTPVHVHADEEEVVYVLGGSGLSWQDGRTYAIEAGDCVVHRCEAEAHTLIAGPDGLDVLVFGEGSRTSLTHLPRAGVMWAAPHWVPPEGPHPLEAELAAGPLEVPDPEPERPPRIVARADVMPVDVQRGPTNLRHADLGRAAGSVRSGLQHLRIAAGARGWPRHVHSAEEELFVVLGGAGEVALGEERFAVRPGHVVARPPGSGVAHAFLAGDAGLELLAYGTRVPGDVTAYPDSGKVSLRGLGPVRFRAEPVDFWDGEEWA